MRWLDRWRDARGMALGCATVAAALGLWMLPSRSDARPSRRQAHVAAAVTLRLGEATSHVRAYRDLAPVLRDLVASEAGALSHVRFVQEPLPTPRPRGYVLRASVTQFDRHVAGPSYYVRCGVSIVLEEARRGDVRLMSSGRASAEGTAPRNPRQARTLEDAALRSAVRSALRPITPTLLARL